MEDIDRIMEVMDDAFEPRWGEAWTRGQVSSLLTLPSTHYRLVDSAGARPVDHAPTAGFTLVRAVPGEEELLLIGVKPQDRASGLGRKLLDFLVRDARSRGAERVFLEMRENNPAVNLYVNAGFRQIGRRSGYYKTTDGVRLDAITFALDF
ncbi:GNAT family N-acetyltransferase [Parerythrobacter lacustris]|nr:GNAT family N-acetyltransferase [Parerythrobacter lacustris]